MNNQREIYEALLAGETLVNIDTGKKLELTNGRLSDYGNDSWETEDFCEWKSWEIYKEPKWYENIPEGGVLCYDGISSDELFFVTEYDKRFSEYPYRTVNNGYSNAIPILKSTIQVFMDNVPEEV